MAFRPEPIVLRHGDTLVCTRHHAIATVTQPIHRGEEPTRRKLALVSLPHPGVGPDDTLTARCPQCDGVWWRWSGQGLPEFRKPDGWTVA